MLYRLAQINLALRLVLLLMTFFSLIGMTIYNRDKSLHLESEDFL